MEKQQWRYFQPFTFWKMLGKWPYEHSSWHFSSWNPNVNTIYCGRRWGIYLKTYLLRLYAGCQIEGDITKTHFNYRLPPARRVVENAFDILAQRFRIFRRQLKSKPENVDKIVLASCTLHNYIKDASAISAKQQDTPDEGALILSQLPRQGGNAPNRSFEIREAFRRFLNSPQGALPWSTWDVCSLLCSMYKLYQLVSCYVNRLLIWLNSNSGLCYKNLTI